MNIKILFPNQLALLVKNKIQYNRAISKLINISLILFLLIQSVGCVPDPYRQAVDAWTEKMPDEVASAYAQIINAGISAVPNSPLIYSCLGSHAQSLPTYVLSAQGLGWNNVSAMPQFRELLLRDEFRELLTKLDLAVGNCGARFAGGQDPNLAMIDQLLREQIYINEHFFDELSDSSPDTHERYLACMAEIDEQLRNNACNPLADTEYPERMEYKFGEGSRITVDRSQSSPPSSSGTGNPDGDGGDSTASPTNSPTSSSTSSPTVPQSTSGTKRIPFNGLDKDGNPFSGYVVRDQDGNIIETEITDHNGTQLINREYVPTMRGLIGGVLGALVALGVGIIIAPMGISAVTAFALGVLLGQLHTFIYENSIPHWEQMCPPTSGVMDERLPTGHELMGKNYQIDGIPAGPAEQYDACNCLFDRTNPLTGWGCMSEADQRRDCILNPYGPDDAPRPECIELLYEDVGADPSPMCPIDCPEGYALTTNCTCGNPAAETAVIIGDNCVSLTCPAGEEPQIDLRTGVCGCTNSAASEICENPLLCNESVVPTPPDPCENPPFCGLP